MTVKDSNMIYDEYIKEFNTKWNIGDKVYCYYTDPACLWQKKETVITDISSMYIFTDEKELVYEEVVKKYNLKGGRTDKWGYTQLIIPINHKYVKIFDQKMELANKVVENLTYLQTPIKYCEILFHQDYIKELLKKSQELIDCFKKAYNMEYFSKNFMKSYCDNMFIKY